METISVNGKRYYNLDDIKEYHHDFVYGMTSNASVLKKNKVPDDMHIKAIKNNGAWEQKKNNANENRDLINKAWFLKNYKFDNETKDAPDILQVKKKEMFLDDDDEQVPIEMRGERDITKCFFLASDVSKYLGCISVIKKIPTLDTYTASEDYQYFFILNDNSRRKKYVFLTYPGLLKIFRNSRQEVAKKYITWANKTLFDIKHGTIEAKKKIVTSIVGTSAKSISQFMGKVLTLISCIYLFELGTVKDLRSQLDIDENHADTDIVHKLGQTTDFKKRAAAHNLEYGKYEGVNLKLIMMAEIDKKFLFEAEAMIDTHVKLKNFIIETEETSYEELVAIPKAKMVGIKKLYTDIAKKYKTSVEIFETNLERADQVIKTKETVIKKLEDNIEDLRNSIGDKDEIIKMLKAKLAKKN